MATTLEDQVLELQKSVLAIGEMLLNSHVELTALRLHLKSQQLLGADYDLVLRTLRSMVESERESKSQKDLLEFLRSYEGQTQ